MLKHVVICGHFPTFFKQQLVIGDSVAARCTVLKARGQAYLVTVKGTLDTHRGTVIPAGVSRDIHFKGALQDVQPPYNAEVANPEPGGPQATPNRLGTGGIPTA